MANQKNQQLLESIAGLAVRQAVYNRAGDLRAAGITIEQSISDDKLITHIVGDLYEKLELAAAESDEPTELE